MPYEVISTRENNYFSPGCPVCLEKSAVLYHTDTKKKYIQLRLVNRNKAALSECTVNVTAYNSFNKILTQEDYTYSNLHVNYNESFGQKNLIILKSDEDVHDLKVVVKEASFWGIKHSYNIHEPQRKVQTTESIESICGRELSEKIKHILKYNDDKMYLPIEEENDVWQCICKTVNKGDTCCSCGQKKKNVFFFFRDGTKEKIAERAEEYKRQREKVFKKKRKWISGLALLFLSFAVVLGAIDIWSRVTDKYDIFKSDEYDLMREYSHAQENAFIERQSALKKFILTNKDKLGGKIVGFSECYHYINIDNFNEETWQVKENSEERSKVDLYKYSIDQGYVYVDTVEGNFWEQEAAWWEIDGGGLSDLVTASVNGKLLMATSATKKDPASLRIYDPAYDKGSWRSLAEYPYGINGCYLGSVDESYLFPGYFVFKVCVVLEKIGEVDTKLQVLDLKENRLVEKTLSDLGYDRLEALPDKIATPITDNKFDWISYASIGNNLIEAHNIGDSSDITVKVTKGDSEGMEETYKAETVVDDLYIKAACSGDSSIYLDEYIDNKRSSVKRVEMYILVFALPGFLLLICALLMRKKGGKSNGRVKVK